MTKAEPQAEWDQGYMAHVQVMLRVHGIDSAQRLKRIQGELTQPSQQVSLMVSYFPLALSHRQ